MYPELGTWDKPLATKVVTTSAGGAFQTNMEVRSKELRKLLEDLGEGVEKLEKLRVRVVAELLEVDPVDVLSGGLLAHHAMKTTAEDDAVLRVGKDGGVHVISDIDDTVKVRPYSDLARDGVLIAFEQWTEVLGGTKTIFRNVFVRELHEIQVRLSSSLLPSSLTSCRFPAWQSGIARWRSSARPSRTSPTRPGSSGASYASTFARPVSPADR